MPIFEYSEASIPKVLKSNLFTPFASGVPYNANANKSRGI